MATSNLVDLSEHVFMKKPKRFHGSRSEDVVSWLRSFETCAKCNDWSDGDKVRMVPIFLDGYASTVYQFEIEPKVSDWTDIKRALVKMFTPRSGQLATFTSRRQSIGEPCIKYILEMQSLVALDDKAFTDSFVFSVIREGLLP